MIPVAIALCIAVELSLLALLAFATRGGTTGPALALYVASGAPWAYVLSRARNTPEAHGLRTALGVGALARAVVLLGLPVFSDDLYRFVWDGRVLASGVNPYRFPPDALPLAALRDAEVWPRVNHPEVSTVYPPIAQLLFVLVAFAGGGPLLVRVLVAVLDVFAIALVAEAGRRRGAPEAGLAYALCPLAVVESALSGHFDGVAAALLLATLVLAVRPLRAGLAFGLSIALKALALFALPALCLGRPRRTTVAALGLGVALALTGPFASAGLGLGRGLSEFGLRWSGNASAFRLLEDGAHAALQSAEDRPGAVRVPALGALSERLDGTPLDPRAPLRREKKSEERDVFETSYLASLVTRTFAVALALALAFAFATRLPPDRAVLAALAAALLLGPLVHPWYVLWLVPLACVLRAKPWLLWASLAPLALLPLDTFRATGEWREPVWVPFVEYGPVYALLVATHVAPKLRRVPTTA